MWFGKYGSDGLAIEDNRVYDTKEVDTALAYRSMNLPN